jgi:hypothetical protein
MTSYWSYTLDMHEMLKERDIFVQKRDEEFKKWKEYVKSFHGQDLFDYSVMYQYNDFVKAIKIIEEGINNETKRLIKPIIIE